MRCRLALLSLCLPMSMLWGQSAPLSKEDLRNASWFFDLETARQTPEEVYKLDLSRQGLTELPPEVLEMPNLRILLLNHNQLRHLPPEIGRLQKLVELEINDNELEELPPALFTLGALAELEASRNRIRELPPQVRQLFQLTEIELNENRLTSLPEEVGELAELEELKVGHNQLTTLPDSILQLEQLGELMVESNQLTTLWPDIHSLKNLRDLDLSNNNFTCLPPALFDFHLSLFHLKNNPLAQPFGEREIAALLRAEDHDLHEIILAKAESGDVTTVEAYLLLAEGYLRDHGRQSELAELYLTAAFAQRDLGRLDLAGRFAEQAREMADRVNLDLANLDEDDADPVFANTNEVIRDAANFRELLQSEYEREALRSKVRWLLLSIIGLLIGLCGYVFWSRRRVQRYNAILTEQRQQLAEQADALQKANATLTARQTEILAQKERIERQASDLRRLNATKDRFFSIIGHDLRNPFAAIENLAHFIEVDAESATPAELRHRARLIAQSAGEASLLLNNLLDWARTQTNDLSLRPDFVHPAKLVEQTLTLLRPALDDKDIGVDCTIAPGTVVFADPRMLQAVFRNLIGNAIKFSHVGGQIQVNGRDTGTQYELEVVDQGVGMEQSQAEALLRTDRVPSHTGTRGEKGSGLGLQICRDFVARNEGELSVVSSPDFGTRFIIRLPKVGLQV